ncbi:MAG: Gfo/Idh/MocA family oxidoreductase [Clostridia bacterium]|nr:Gfo/Idh/MocA family oxidoreductase [Clostridia bacterium]
MKTVLVIGAGSRGTCYSEIGAAIGDAFKIVAVAEPIDARRNYMRDKFGIPEEMCHLSWEDFLSRPKFADIAIIATMDRDHIAPALAAIEKGYDLILEKPMGATPEECCQIERAAAKKGVFVQVCHVLRFTPFFCALKSLILDGKIGKVVHIQHAECVGNVHQSHSFVRGNWGNSDRSTPMIVQKTCHDMDIMQWLIGKNCTRVHSFGSLTYFKAENAPEGAPERCIDGCPHADTCYYNAVRLYTKDLRNSSFIQAVVPDNNRTEEDILEALRTTNYGRCVFRCDNNVVDHQTVNLEFEDGITASFTMCAFNKGSRNIRIMGTDGELIANMGDQFITLYDFATQKFEKINISDVAVNETIDGGHGGGDAGIMNAVSNYLNNAKATVSLCSIKETCRNHLIAYAAEESRLTGKVVDMAEYEKRLGGLI